MSIFSDIEHPIRSAQRVGYAAEKVAKTAVHPIRLAKALPGAVVDTATLGAALAAQIGGEGVSVIGRVSGDAAVTRFGNAMRDVPTHIQEAALADPLHATEILAGAAAAAAIDVVPGAQAIGDLDVPGIGSLRELADRAVIDGGKAIIKRGLRSYEQRQAVPNELRQAPEAAHRKTVGQATRPAQLPRSPGVKQDIGFFAHVRAAVDRFLAAMRRRQVVKHA